MTKNRCDGPFNTYNREPYPHVWLPLTSAVNIINNTQGSINSRPSIVFRMRLNNRGYVSRAKPMDLELSIQRY